MMSMSIHERQSTRSSVAQSGAVRGNRAYLSGSVGSMTSMVTNAIRRNQSAITPVRVGRVDHVHGDEDSKHAILPRVNHPRCESRHVADGYWKHKDRLVDAQRHKGLATGKVARREIAEIVGAAHDETPEGAPVHVAAVG